MLVYPLGVWRRWRTAFSGIAVLFKFTKRADFKVLPADFSSGIRAAVVVSVPLVLVACSNSKPTAVKTENAPIAGLPIDQGDGALPVPLKKPSLGLVVEIVSSNEVENTGSAGQNFAAVRAPEATTNVISNQTKFSSKAYGVAGSPRVTTGTNVRKGGGRYQVGKPYTIRGVRYVPQENPNYKATGLASWYGPNFHGRLTANGEVYDQFALSAAHPTMPLPSYAKVTNLENGSSVTVRVNDRGPFSKGRIIDLSSRAAQLLGYTKKGVAKVKVEYVGRARMDGLDERQLLASYNPGRLDPNSIPASARPTVVASTKKKPVAVSQKPTVVAVVTQPKASDRTLNAFDTSRFGSQSSEIQTAPRPQSLVNGYASEANFGEAESKISTYFDQPIEGMAALERLKVGPVYSKAELFELSEDLSNFGPVSIVESDGDHVYFLEVTVVSDDVEKIKNLLN